MAFIDFHFIWSGKFAKLKPSSRILLHVITGVCNRKTGQFYHSVPTLSKLAGLSQSATRYALRELESHDPPILSSQPRLGKPNLKVHIPTAQFAATPVSITTTPAMNTGVPRQPLPGSPDKNPYQTPEPSAYPASPLPPNNNNPKQQKTTTAADRISPALIAEMTEVYGGKKVMNVVVAMRSMNGEIQNSNAYFRTCLMRGYIPTSKKARQRQEQQARSEAAQKAQEQRRLQREQEDQEFLREQKNPEVQAHIQAEIAKANRMLGIQIEPHDQN